MTKKSILDYTEANLNVDVPPGTGTDDIRGHAVVGPPILLLDALKPKHVPLEANLIVAVPITKNLILHVLLDF